MSVIGYARVSTSEQSLTVQVDALRAAGCEDVHQDHGVSGKSSSRAGLDAALAAVGDGDTLMVHRLDRLGRSLSHLARLLEELPARGVTVRSLREGLDTSTPAGRMVLQVLGSVAQYETELRKERQVEGIARAKAEGRYKGRKRALTPAQEAEVVQGLAAGRLPSELARLWNVSRATIHRIRARSRE